MKKPFKINKKEISKKAARFTRIASEQGCLVINSGELFEFEGFTLHNFSDNDLFLTVDAGGVLHASYCVINKGKVRSEKSKK